MASRASLFTVMLLAACSSADPAATLRDAAAGSGEPSQLPVPEDCVNPPPDITTLIEQDQRAACYGSTDLVVEAHASVLMGAIDCPGDLQPSWMACGGTIVELYALEWAGIERQFVLAARSPHEGPMLSAVVHPDSGIDLSRGLDAPMTVTGHFDDPAARTCRYMAWPDDHPPAPEEVVAGCRETFVITGLEFLDVERSSPTAGESPSSDAAVAPHDIAEVVTTDLVVRSAPGVGPDSTMFGWTLDAPTLLYVFDGPVSADGYDWYQVMPSRIDYLPSEYGVGWVAAGSKDGEPWIGPAAPTCPPVGTQEIAALSPLGQLACFGETMIELEGDHGGCMARDPAASPAEPWPTRCWLAPFGCCPNVIPYPSGITTWFDVVLSTPFDGPQPSRIIGQFNHASAVDCPDTVPEGAAPPPDGWGRFVCRTSFVVIDVVPLDADPSS